jgi:hypothetical protein
MSYHCVYLTLVLRQQRSAATTAFDTLVVTRRFLRSVRSIINHTEETLNGRHSAFGVIATAAAPRKKVEQVQASSPCVICRPTSTFSLNAHRSPQQTPAEPSASAQPGGWRTPA